MKIERLAAIDIGSNAMRLLIMNVYEEDQVPVFNKSILVRAPVRLGSDSFVRNEIAPDTVEKMLHAMKSFYHLMKTYDVVAYKACATSAMREAENAAFIVEKIRDEAGIEIEVIDGKREAEIIYKTQILDFIETDQAYLFVDVGGGSTELTLFKNKKSIASKSFNIGTIRILKDLVQRSEWDALTEWIRTYIPHEEELVMIGSGGNINTVFKKSQKSLGSALSYKYMKNFLKELKQYTVDERIKVFGFNPDRADVIVPAMEIYTQVMKLANIKDVYVPKIGLADGLIRAVYEEYKISKGVNQLHLEI